MRVGAVAEHQAVDASQVSTEAPCRHPSGDGSNRRSVSADGTRTVIADSTCEHRQHTVNGHALIPTYCSGLPTACLHAAHIWGVVLQIVRLRQREGRGVGERESKRESGRERERGGGGAGRHTDRQTN